MFGDAALNSNRNLVISGWKERSKCRESGNRITSPRTRQGFSFSWILGDKQLRSNVPKSKNLGICVVKYEGTNSSCLMESIVHISYLPVISGVKSRYLPTDWLLCASSACFLELQDRSVTPWLSADSKHRYFSRPGIFY